MLQDIKKLISVVLALFVMITANLNAQKETTNWTFGARAGLTWNNPQNNISVIGINTPNITLNNMPESFKVDTRLTSDRLYTQEGVFNISDKEGNLMFYSDGSTIWNNKFDRILVNGLPGESGSAQSGIAIPYPGNPNLYICIGISMVLGDKMSYVLVNSADKDDIKISGNVVPFSGHEQSIGESLSAIMHRNKKDWWIVAPSRGPKCVFNSWLATDSGVHSTTPVKTTVDYETAFSGQGGYFKFTPSGKHFLYGLGSHGFMVGQFDNQNGTFSNVKYFKIDASIDPFSVYGIEFSLNEKYVYTTSRVEPYIYVWDLQSLLNDSNPQPLKKLSSDLLGSSNTSQFGALQLDPYGRIWIVDQNNGNSLFIIDNPDEAKADLRFYRLQDYLKNGTETKPGLLTFSASFSSFGEVDSEKSCVNTNKTFTVKVSAAGTDRPNKLRWDFGNGEAPNDIILSATATEQSVTFSYTKPGNYTITITGLDYNDNEIAGQQQTIPVLVLPCVISVNPNIHYYNNN